jgi:NAD(P)-dependent dehydrogenase (short-subunit alcohol dehydrogenase family)
MLIMTPSKTFLITGASKGGIGDALAREFHGRGFRVFASVRTPSKADHLKELGIEIVQLDVTSSESIRSAAREVRETTGGTLDILVNNSGVSTYKTQAPEH